MVGEIELRDLSRRASEVVQAVEAGATLTITISGRPVAQIVPMQDRQWRAWSEVHDVLSGARVPFGADDLSGVDDTLSDPFERHADTRPAD